ncbi:MAG TPA: serine hydrolase domain-containing protein [Cyclobacteriaceae bacterium]|nr:serine hydrolase domain-containing protein [Cyclobacteriaceae bacterium]
MRPLFSALLLLFSITVVAQTFTAASKPEDAGMSGARLSKIDKLIEEHIGNKWIPGAVVFIARNGKIVYHKAYGYADVENKTALKKDNIFRIASQSKAITSLAVMMLYEDGKFGLDDAISKYIPEFKNPKVLSNLNWRDTTYTTTPAKSEITIRQLLTHTSGVDYAGIGNQEFKAIYAKAGVPSGIGNDDMVLAEKIKTLGGLPLKHNPGEAYTYGLNMDVLGYLVEVLSGMSFDQFLRTKIFQPLGMNDTYFYLPKEKHNRLVSLYEMKDGTISKMTAKAYDNVNPMYPTLEGKYYSGGAGLSSSPEDYAKFLQMFLNKGEYNGVRLLSRKTVELMLTPQVQPPLNNQVGLGFGLETEKNDHASPFSIGTFSWGGAFNTQYWADPKEKLIGIIYMNTYGGPNRNTADKFKVLTYSAIAD